MQDTPRQSPLLGILKGAVIAIGALLPGISGGALCVIMGIYKPMMALLADPIHQFKKQIGFFWPIAVGMLVGTLGISKLLGDFLERSETAAIFLFIGLIVGTLPSLLREARQQGVARGSMAALAIALVVMLAWMIPMSLGGQANVIPNFGWWCLCGVLWGLGIIVPGMSPSNIFFFLGLATPMYASIGALDLGVILPMGVCLLLTVVLLSPRCGLLPQALVFAVHARGGGRGAGLHGGDSAAGQAADFARLHLCHGPGRLADLRGLLRGRRGAGLGAGQGAGEGIKNRPAPKGSGCTGALGPKAQSNLEMWANTRAARGQRAERRYLQGSETGGESDRQAGPPNLPNGFWTV